MRPNLHCIEGGVGKHLAATAVIKAYKNAHPKRKIVVVSAFPEIFLKNKDVARFYRIGAVPYFYEDYILKKDAQIFAQDPYRQTSHITKQSHIIMSQQLLILISEKKRLQGA